MIWIIICEKLDLRRFSSLCTYTIKRKPFDDFVLASGLAGNPMMVR